MQHCLYMGQLLHVMLASNGSTLKTAIAWTDSVCVVDPLQEVAASGADVLIVFCMGEGVSIARRLKALQLTFSGVLMTSSPAENQWPALLGPDGDYVVTPAQWDSSQMSPCFRFGDSQAYSEDYKERFGSTPNYFAALLTASGLILELAMRVHAMPPPHPLPMCPLSSATGGGCFVCRAACLIRSYLQLLGAFLAQNIQHADMQPYFLCRHTIRYPRT